MELDSEELRRFIADLGKHFYLSVTLSDMLIRESCRRAASTTATPSKETGSRRSTEPFIFVR